MDELQRVLERQVRELASGVLGQPQCSALDRSAEADVSVGLGGQERMFAYSRTGQRCADERRRVARRVLPRRFLNLAARRTASAPSRRARVPAFPGDGSARFRVAGGLREGSGGSRLAATTTTPKRRKAASLRALRSMPEVGVEPTRPGGRGIRVPRVCQFRHSGEPDRSPEHSKAPDGRATLVTLPPRRTIGRDAPRSPHRRRRLPRSERGDPCDRALSASGAAGVAWQKPLPLDRRAVAGMQGRSAEV